LDCYAISKFNKSASKADDLQWEFDVVHALLVQIRHANVTAKIDYIRGNHEERLEKYLNSRAKEIRSLRDLTIERQLRLEELKINYTDRVFLNDQFVVTHGTRTTKQSAKAELDHCGISGMSGHVHRTNSHMSHDIMGNTKRWYSLGHLSVAKDMDYAAPFYHTWDQSFGIIRYDEKSFNVTIIEVQDGFEYEGKTYKKANR